MYVRSSVWYVKCKKSLIKHTFNWLFAHLECNLDRIHKNKCTIFFLIRRYTRAVAKQWSTQLKQFMTTIYTTVRAENALYSNNNSIYRYFDMLAATYYIGIPWFVWNKLVNKITRKAEGHTLKSFYWFQDAYEKRFGKS